MQKGLYILLVIITCLKGFQEDLTLKSTLPTIADCFIKALKLPSSQLTIHFQQYIDDSSVHIIEDLFNMGQFDYLIRPSSFSKTAELIGNFKMTISPNSYVWRNNVLIMDTVQITYYKENKTRTYIIPLYNNGKHIDKLKNIIFSYDKNILF